MTLCWSIEFNPVWPLMDKSFSLACKCNAALRQVVALPRSSPSLGHWIVMRTPFWNQHFVLWFHQFLYQSHWLSLRRHRLFYLVLDMYGLVWHEPFQWLCSGGMRSKLEICRWLGFEYFQGFVYFQPGGMRTNGCDCSTSIQPKASISVSNP